MNMSTTKLPPLLQPEVSQLWQDFQAKASPEELGQHPSIFESLPKVWACDK